NYFLYVRCYAPSFSFRGSWDNAIEVFDNHRQRSTDEISVSIRQISVVSLHQRVEAEAPVLPKRNLTKQKVAKNIRREEVLFVLPVLLAKLWPGSITRSTCQSAK